MKIRITKEQARILENLNDKKVLKITEEQYKELLKLESVDYPQITKAISKVNPQAGAKFKRYVSSETRIKGVLHEDLFKEFVNELYGLNESGKNTYESLIKLMEAMGYVENRKLSKTTFEGDKDLAKKVITSGLAKLHECGSAYMAMEAMDNEREAIIQSFRQQLTQKPENTPNPEQIATKLAQLKSREEERRIAAGEKVKDISEIDGEETSEVTDEVDTITMDVPLFLRALEYSREDAKNDLNLHDITQNAVRLSKEYDTLTMDNYYEIFGDEENTNPVDDVMSENEQTGGIIGLDILNYPPFSNLPETRAESGDYTTRMEPTLPSLETPDASVVMFSKQDFVDYEFQGPKMMHRNTGYINLFKQKFGEEPIFINIKDLGRRGSADIANEKFIQWRDSGIASKAAWLDTERGAGRTSGLDEIEVDEAASMGGSGAVFGNQGGDFPVGKLGHKNEEKIYEALNALKKKITDESEDGIEEATTTVSAGPFGYDTPGFAASEFMGTKGKKGKAPVSTKKKTPIWPGGKIVGESATDKTQWAGGAFVEFDDCTKLNNNKEAQKGGCSTGAVDNVVKLKKTASNVNAPSLGKKQQ